MEVAGWVQVSLGKTIMGKNCPKIVIIVLIFWGTVEPLLYDHPQNHIGVVV